VQLEGVLGALVALPEAELGEAGVTIVGDAPSEEDTETEAETEAMASPGDQEAELGPGSAREPAATTTIVGSPPADTEDEDEEAMQRLLGPPPSEAGR